MPVDLGNQLDNQGVAGSGEINPESKIRALLREFHCRVGELKESFENFDKDGNIEHNIDIFQKLYYLVALTSVIRSYFTPNGIKGSLGLLWIYFQDLWNVVSVIFAMIFLPRLYREKNNPDTASVFKSCIFYSNAIFFPLLLLITLTSMASSTRDAIENNFDAVFFNSIKTLGNVYVASLATLSYGVGMMILALTPLDNFLIARAKLLANSVFERIEKNEKTPLNIQESSTVLIDSVQPARAALTEQDITELNLKIRQNGINFFRDVVCAAGAVFGAASMLKDPDQFLLAAMILYGVSTVINVGQGAHQLVRTGIFGRACNGLRECVTPVFPYEHEARRVGV